ncbi:hypothetical protein V9T40_010796 [Parthenolecanium corni]|uniref:RNA-directed DNA polymerase n=1 Tax=Parthenolecanium corni TaxID=536013 RepID=A0AAN9T6S6_9HEMI
MAPPRNLRHQVDPPVPPALQALPASLVANIRPPPSINVHGDRAEEWTLFDQQFTWFAAATSLTNQPEPVQIAVFMSSIGPEAVKEFNSLKLSPDELSSLSQIRSALQHRFAPKVNYRFERYQFNKIIQEPPTETDLEVLVVLPISAPALLEFQEATTSDPELPLLTETILHGWPDKINEVPPPIRKYFNFREDLSVHQNLVLKSDQIVVPLSLRPKMLKLIHQGHLGTTSCINRARSALFWLGMTEDINRFVTTCEVCQSTHKRKQPEPLITKPIPQRPWEIVATDIFQLGTKHFLLIADSYSGFVDYKQLTTLTSYPVIQALKYWFSIHGIPDYLDSDGGPQFSSAEFAAFAKSWHFTHRISSPHYPQSNGLAERNVATVKNILMKCAKDNSDPYLALLNWRNTPRSQTLQSPNERLMSRQTKTLLPVSSENLQPKIVSNVPDSLSAARQQQKLYADRRATPQPSFQQGESVLVQEGSRYWVRGRIVEVLPEPRSYKVETESGQIFRRNSSFIRHSSLPFFRKPTSNYTSANQTDQAPSSSIASRPRRTIKPPQRLNL